MRYLKYLVVLLILTSSCKYLNRNRMLQTDAFYKYAQFNDSLDKVYKIGPNDVIEFRLYSNDGYRLIDVFSVPGSAGSGASITLNVESDGQTKMPVLGRVKVSGMTLKELESYLESKYSEFYNKPFVILRVSNKRVTIFAGGHASVVNLTNDNTTLFEVLAVFGGIPETGFADKIKIIRGNLKSPQVFIVDLSTLNGVQNADLVMQANDIIYIEIRREPVLKAFSLISPYISMLTTLLSLYVTYQFLKVQLK